MKLFLAYLYSAVNGLCVGLAIYHIFGPMVGFPLAVLMGIWGVWSAIVLVNAHDKRQKDSKYENILL